MDELILAVDGGQTSTKAIIDRRDGTILGQGRGTPCDHIHGANGVARNRAAIHSAANAALANASVRAEDIVGVGLGLTSAPREQDASAVFRGIGDELCSPRAFWVDADFVSNLAGASAGGDCLCIPVRERLGEGCPFAENRDPAQTGLKPFQYQPLEELTVIVAGAPPFRIVILDVERIASHPTAPVHLICLNHVVASS